MLCFTSYYHKVIPAQMDLIRLPIHLTHKTVPPMWTNQCQKAFDLLKEAFMKAQFWSIQILMDHIHYLQIPQNMHGLQS